MPASQLRINAPTIVHETIDGETIVIHLGTGTYYSLDGSGAEVWTLLEQGARSGEVVSLMQQRYDADPDVVKEGVVSLLGQLIQDGVVVEDEQSVNPSPSGAGGPDGGKRAAPFPAPVLHRYTDMQEFMLVDPLHDVDESAGWPHAKAH